MLDSRRWWVECEIMKQRFPWFSPFETEGGNIGFFGHLRGPSSGRLYEVVLKVPARVYPQTEPPIYISPRLGSNWREDTVNHDRNGKLCYDRSGHIWNPATSTFANCILVAADYLKSQNA
jgi:ubiquitin-protein ligase